MSAINVARRARLKVVVSEKAETDAIVRILCTRLRERRERLGALARREAHSIKEAHWISVDRALEIEGTTDPTRLRVELKLALPCRFQHRQRWWWSKPVEEVAPLLAGRNPLDLQDDRWELVIHEKFWRERLGKAADAPPIVTDTTINLVELSAPSVQLRPAPESEIRNAVQAEYDEAAEAGRKAPNIKEVPPLVQVRLEARGFDASQREIARVADGYKDRRRPSGRTLKSEGSRVDFALSHTAKSEKSGITAETSRSPAITVDGDSQ